MKVAFLTFYVLGVFTYLSLTHPIHGKNEKMLSNPYQITLYTRAPRYATIMKKSTLVILSLGIALTFSLAEYNVNEAYSQSNEGESRGCSGAPAALGGSDHNPRCTNPTPPPCHPAASGCPDS